MDVSAATRSSPSTAIISVATNPGANHVDRDVAGRHLAGQRAGEAHQRRLGGPVVRLAGEPMKATTDEMRTMRPRLARTIGPSARFAVR